MRLTIIAVAALGGCSVAVPVTGYIGDTPAQGQAEASMTDGGSFHVITTGGLRCGGTYDAMSTDPTITAPLSCSDGRSGTAVITRTMDMLSGTVIAELDDGTTGRFVFGNLSFAQTGPEPAPPAVPAARPAVAPATIGATEPPDRCTAISRLAEEIMRSHQAGVAMTEAMRIGDQNTLESVRRLHRDLVVSAYQQPRYSGFEYRQRAIDNFRDEAAVACYRG